MLLSSEDEYTDSHYETDESEENEDNGADEVALPWQKLEQNTDEYKLFVDEDYFLEGGKEELLSVAKRMDKLLGVFNKDCFESHLYVWLDRTKILDNLRSAVSEGLPPNAKPITRKEVFYFVFDLLRISGNRNTLARGQR